VFVVDESNALELDGMGTIVTWCKGFELPCDDCPGSKAIIVGLLLILELLGDALSS
tara:strand:+ start:514 stop:681 length:168 start_codon:yes stop_codon:yes gene_type:complete